MAKTLSRTKLPWGPRGYYEGKPSFRKTTALTKNKTKTNEGPELKGKSAKEERTKKAETQHAPAEPRNRGPERISIAVGNIPAPGLGKLGAVQICCHAEISVKYNLRMPTYRFCCNLVI